jgi:hypothetical protein
MALLLVLAAASVIHTPRTADGATPPEEQLQQSAYEEPLAPSECRLDWHPVSHPDVGYLTEVHAISPSDVYVAGNQGLLHWDGIAWSIVYTETYPPLDTITGLSWDDVWAVGGNRILHWDGTSWVKYDAPTYYMFLRAIAEGAPDRAWAVGGGEFSGTYTPDMAYWDGNSWRTIYLAPGAGPNVPEGGGCEPFGILTGAVAVSPNEMWAVGSSGSNYPCTQYSPIMVHCVNDTCTSVAAITANRRMERAGPNDFWAVGDRSIARYVNGSWVYTPHPDTGTLLDIGGSAPGDVWAVGPDGFLHYDGHAWDVFPSGTGASRVSAASVTAAWAITGTDILRYDPMFSDVSPNSDFYPFIRCLACNGVIGGYADGTFGPGNNITRGQLSKIVANAAGFDEHPAGQSFEDVDNSSPYWVYIERMASRGIIAGYPCGRPSEPCGPDELPYFRPGSYAARDQIAKVVSNAAGFQDQPAGQVFEDVPAGHPFYVWVQRLASRNIVQGYACGGASEPCGPNHLPYYRPGSRASRGQVSKIVAITFFPGCQTPGDGQEREMPRKKGAN